MARAYRRGKQPSNHTGRVGCAGDLCHRAEGTGKPIGSIGLHRNDLAENDDEMELGYWLGVPYWGRGLVPEAAEELLRHAFQDLGLARVWCGYYDGNDKSKRVQEKLGFRYQWTSEDAPVPQMGETRVGHVNLLTKEEWSAGKQHTQR